MADTETHVRKSKTLFVRNLPYKTTNEELEVLFSDIGPVKRCFVVSKTGTDECRGFGYVTYSLLEDAEKAKDTVITVYGRKLGIDFAGRKKDFTQRLKQKVESTDKDSEDEAEKEVKAKASKKREPEKVSEKNLKSKGFQQRKKVDMPETKELHVMGWNSSWSQAKVFKFLKQHKVNTISKLKYPGKNKSLPVAVLKFKSGADARYARVKLSQLDINGEKLTVTSYDESGTIQQKNLRQCRIIVRNLSFKCKEENLKEIFSKFGYVLECHIPLKPGTDGKMYGFGFVQFVDLRSASKAVAEMNMKFILGRKVAVDWAVPKDKYLEAVSQKQITGDTAITTPHENTESGSATSESKNSDEGSFSADCDDDGSDERESSESEDESADSNMDSEDDGDDSSDEGFGEDDENINEDDPDTEDDIDTSEVQKKKKKSKAQTRKSDVDEGKTLFIRNVQYETHEETLEETLSEFGEVNYCRLVINPDTGLPRGTAFVQFKTSEAAENCLKKACDESKEGGVTVDGRKLLVSLAVSRDKAKEFKPEDKKTKQKPDKRNLHLAREGLIRPGTQAAIGLTKDDLTKRMKVETVKRQKLKNPNIVVSTTRLCVRNIPTSVDDKELKKVFRKAAQDQKAIVTECRIMRDMDRVNSQGVGKSRGYGFVNFTDHKNALQALRTTNNNPDLFGEKKRLIVEFSFENKTAVVAKEKRMERLKARQDTLQKRQQSEVIKSTAGAKSSKQTDNKPKTKLTDKFIGSVKPPEGTVKPKNTKALPSHWGPKIRHKPRPSQIASEKKNKKSVQKSRQSDRPQGHVQQQKRKLDDTQTPSNRKRRRKGEMVDDFDKLVNKYKNKFLSSNKSKWFDS